MTWEDVEAMSFWELVDKMLGGDDAGDEVDIGKVNYIRVLTLSLIPLDWSAIQAAVQQGTAKDFYWLFGEFSKVNFTPTTRKEIPDAAFCNAAGSRSVRMDSKTILYTL